MADPKAVLTSEQQEYLSGFMAGVEARRGLQPGASAPVDVPPDPQRQSQDDAIAAGGQLTPEERAKRLRHPLDRWDEIVARARTDRFPHGLDNFLTRWHGLFYVGPAQDAFMCRLRIPGGLLSSHQMRGIAAIAAECGGGYADATTRANLQIREIPAARGPEVIERLGELGILPKGTGADNVRNITGNPAAGIDPDEIIDTRPLTRALHFHILHSRDLFGLPRKFNIAINGGGRVAVLEETNDIALTATRLGEEVLFRLALGGITGHRDFARPTGVLVAPHELVPLCDAILRVFIAAGDRTDRRRARLKYVLDAQGIQHFLEAVEAKLGRPLRRTDTIDPPPPRTRDAHLGVHPQRQPGLHYVGVCLPVGRMTAAQMRGIATVAEQHGSGTLRLTVWQNLLIPDVPYAAVAAVQEALTALGLDWRASAVRGGLVACTGAAGCKFAAAHTKQHAAALADFLDQRIIVDGPLNIHLTGCPNSCAQHFIGDIGLIATSLERGEETVEAYDLHVGGGAGPDQAIGRLIRPRIAHDALNQIVLDLLRGFEAQRQPGETFHHFTAGHSDEALSALCLGSAAE